MASVPEPVQVAINVMRARITILGFNVAIITFQISELSLVGGAVALPGLDRAVHITSGTALFMGLALSIMAMVSFIVSGAFDRNGACDHWTLLAGDLLMYLALAQTVSGFFGPFQFELSRVSLPDPTQARAFALIRTALAFAGGVAWVMATYLGPLVSLARSPFSRRATLGLGLGYLLLLLGLAGLWATAMKLQMHILGLEGAPSSWLGGLVLPLHW